MPLESFKANPAAIGSHVELYLDNSMALSFNIKVTHATSHTTMNKLQAIVSISHGCGNGFRHSSRQSNNDVSPTLSPVRSSSLSSGLWLKSI